MKKIKAILLLLPLLLCACGFQEFEVLPLWDEANPCQVYVMYLGAGGEKRQL